MNKVFIVKACRNECPYFEVVEMERIMHCGHPHWLGKGMDAGFIITQDNSNGRIPPKCPLRQGPITESKTVSLA